MNGHHVVTLIKTIVVSAIISAIVVTAVFSISTIDKDSSTSNEPETYITTDYEGNQTATIGKVFIETRLGEWEVDTFCVNGVMYFEKFRGSSPLWNPNGTLVTCREESE